MTFTTWLSLFAVALLGAMSPGPSLAMVVKHTLAGGRSNGLCTAWAHACGIAMYAFITMIGLAVVLHSMPIVFDAISYAGALYLAYLGVNALRSKGGVAARMESGERVSNLQSAKEGILISVLNPKITLFFIALFSQFVSIGHTVGAKATIVMTPFVVDGMWYTLIVLLLSNSAVLEKLRAKAAWIDRVSGCVLLALALRVVVSI